MNKSLFFAVSGKLELRETDPRPCSECGNIYKSASTLRKHIQDKHTVSGQPSLTGFYSICSSNHNLAFHFLLTFNCR